MLNLPGWAKADIAGIAVWQWLGRGFRFLAGADGVTEASRGELSTPARLPVGSTYDFANKIHPLGSSSGRTSG
jgi:hypothetical protein